MPTSDENIVRAEYGFVNVQVSEAFSEILLHLIFDYFIVHHFDSLCFVVNNFTYQCIIPRPYPKTYPSALLLVSYEVERL